MARNNRVSISTGKGVDGDGNIVIPGFCSISSLQLITRYNTWVDIQDLVKEVSIFSDLYSPILKGKITIRDNVNLFQSLQFDGSEEFVFLITSEPNGDGIKNPQTNNIKVIFHAERYTRLEKTKDVINVQEIDIDLVCRKAYASKLSRICKGLRFQNGMMGTDPYVEIEKIFEKITIGQKLHNGADIYRTGGAEQNNILRKLIDSNARHENITRIQGNITNRSPLQAIEYLRTKCFDISFSPFFIYPKFTIGAEDKNGFEYSMISSLSDIAEEHTNPIYYPPQRSGIKNTPYTYTAGFTDIKASNPGSDDYYDAQRAKIIDINTNMNMSQLDEAAAGGYGNEVQIIDYLRMDMISKQMNPGIGQESPKWILNDFKPNYLLKDNAAEIPFERIMYDNHSVTLGGAAGFYDGNSNNVELFHQSKSLIHLPASQTISPERSENLPYDPDTISQVEVDDSNNPELGTSEQYHLPSGQLNMDYRTAPELYAQGLNMVKYYIGILNNRQSIEITVHGDIHLNPSVKIEIEIPLSAQIKNNLDKQSTPVGETVDENLSGIYLIVGAAHSFTKGVYYTRLKCIKLRDRPASTAKRGPGTGEQGLKEVMKYWLDNTNNEYIPAHQPIVAHAQRITKI